MAKYTICFTGRKKGSEGVFYPVVENLECEPKDIHRLLYDKYEHIANVDAYCGGTQLSENTLNDVWESTDWKGLSPC